MNIKERIAWLRRMPIHWKILFTSQFIIFTTAIQFRLSDVKRARLIMEEQERQEKENLSLQGQGRKDC